jgi:hypothetical protein
MTRNLFAGPARVRRREPVPALVAVTADIKYPPLLTALELLT